MHPGRRVGYPITKLTKPCLARAKLTCMKKLPMQNIEAVDAKDVNSTLYAAVLNKLVNNASTSPVTCDAGEQCASFDFKRSGVYLSLSGVCAENCSDIGQEKAMTKWLATLARGDTRDDQIKPTATTEEVIVYSNCKLINRKSYPDQVGKCRFLRTQKPEDCVWTWPFYPWSVLVGYFPTCWRGDLFVFGTGLFPGVAWTVVCGSVVAGQFVNLAHKVCPLSLQLRACSQLTRFHIMVMKLTRS